MQKTTLWSIGLNIYQEVYLLSYKKMYTEVVAMDSDPAIASHKLQTNHLQNWFKNGE
jgi:hypothetical protein